MAAGTEFLTSNLQIAYPFRENASGLARTVLPVHGSSATLPLEFLADAYFSIQANAGLLYLKSITAIGGTQYTFLFVNIGGVPQASVTVDTVAWSPAISYERIHVEDVPNGVYGKLVVYIPAALTYLAGTVGIDDFGISLPLEDSVVVPRNASVDTFELYTALPPVPAPTTPGPISGNVQLTGGYNVAMEFESVADADLTNVTLSATPQNQAPCTHEESTYVKGLMQLLPDENGNVQITSGEDGCYSIILVSATVMQIQGTCTACCTCDDYQNVAIALERMMIRAKAALTVLSDAHNGTDGYSEGVTWFNEHVAPERMQPKLLGTGHAGAGWCNDPVVRGGSLHLATITFVVRHNWKYKYALVPDYTITTTGTSKPVSLRGWDTTKNGKDKVIYRGPLIALSGFSYAGAFPTPPPYPWDELQTLKRGEEIQHWLSVQVPYYDDVPITWRVQVAATVQGFNAYDTNPPYAPKILETIVLPVQNMVFT